MAIAYAVHSAIRVALVKCSLHLSKPDRIALATLFKEGFIQEDDLKFEADRKLREIGRACYAEHVASSSGSYRIWPDHTFSPEAFAYALAKGEFTRSEKWQIRFDHGDTEESFIKQYGVDTLLERTVKQWLDTTPLPERMPDSDEGGHCCCSH